MRHSRPLGCPVDTAVKIANILSLIFFLVFSMCVDALDICHHQNYRDLGSRTVYEASRGYAGYQPVKRALWCPKRCFYRISFERTSVPKQHIQQTAMASGDMLVEIYLQNRRGGTADTGGLVTLYRRLLRQFCGQPAGIET